MLPSPNSLSRTGPALDMIDVKVRHGQRTFGGITFNRWERLGTNNQPY
jgi:hypothetical protein